MNFKEQIVNYAVEQYPNDAEKAVEFLQGFVKEASVSDFLSNVMSSSTGPAKNDGETIGHTLRKGLSTAMGKGLGEIAIAAGTTGVGALYGVVSNKANHGRFLQALEKAVRGNPILQQAKKEKVLGYAETVFKFAPSVAMDSNLLSSILANAIHGEGIDPMTIKTLTELEGRYKDNSTFSPKSYV